MFSFDLKSDYHQIGIFPEDKKFLALAGKFTDGSSRYFMFSVLPSFCATFSLTNICSLQIHAHLLKFRLSSNEEKCIYDPCQSIVLNDLLHNSHLSVHVKRTTTVQENRMTSAAVSVLY